MSWWERNSAGIPRRIGKRGKHRPHLITRRSRLRSGLVGWHRRLCVLGRGHADGRHRPVQSSLFLAIGAQVDRAAALWAGTQVDRAAALRARRHRAVPRARRTAADQTHASLSLPPALRQLCAYACGPAVRQATLHENGSRRRGWGSQHWGHQQLEHPLDDGGGVGE